MFFCLPFVFSAADYSFSFFLHIIHPRSCHGPRGDKKERPPRSTSLFTMIRRGAPQAVLLVFHSATKEAAFQEF